MDIEKSRKRKKMETQPTNRPISTGICAFCKAELAKNKMTQHLKFCKQRLATIATQEKILRRRKHAYFISWLKVNTTHNTGYILRYLPLNHYGH